MTEVTDRLYCRSKVQTQSPEIRFYNLLPVELRGGGKAPCQHTRNVLIAIVRYLPP